MSSIDGRITVGIVQKSNFAIIQQENLARKISTACYWSALAMPSGISASNERTIGDKLVCHYRKKQAIKT
jgi:hypothetical protein